MESLVYPALLVLLVYRVNQDSEERRVTVVSSVFLEHLDKRVLRVTLGGKVHQDRLGWRGFQVPWDQLDPRDHLGHQGHRTAVLVEETRPVACLESEAHLDHRVHLALQVYLVSQVYQAPMETKGQRDQEDLLGFQVSTGSPDRRLKRETEEREERGVCQGEMAGHLDLQGLPDLQDRSPTSQQAIEEVVFQVDQDSQGPQDQKVTRETQVLQDTHLKVRKERLASSWGLTGDPCTSVV